MTTLRSISTQFWNDDLIGELKTDEKLLFLYFLTNDQTNMLGVYKLPLRKVCYDTGMSKTEIETIINKFQELDKIYYIDNYVIIKNFIKNQAFNTNMKKSTLKIFNKLPLSIKDKFILNLNEDFKLDKVNIGFGWIEKLLTEFNPNEPFKMVNNCLVRVKERNRIRIEQNKISLNSTDIVANLENLPHSDPNNLNLNNVNNKEEEKKKEKSCAKKEKRKIKPISERVKDFEALVLEKVKLSKFEHEKELLRDFISYWSEYGDNDVKFRKEKEKSFDIIKRLGRWKANERNKSKKSDYDTRRITTEKQVYSNDF